MRAIITKDNRIIVPVDSPTESCLGCDCNHPGAEGAPCSYVQKAGENCDGVVWQEMQG
jgi:hypothetical protein